MASPLMLATALFLSACGSDPRTAKTDKGDLTFAPVRTPINADAASGTPKFPDGLPVPSRGFVIVETSYGDITAYAFDAKSSLLSGLWVTPAAPGFAQPPPEQHRVTLAKDEAQALIRLINLAWGAHRKAPGAAMPRIVEETVWLVDGAQNKALDGYRAGAVIISAVTSLAQKHKIVPDNHET